MVSAADSLLKYLNYCLHEELLSLEELTSVGQALSEGDVMSDASLLLEETYQLSDYFIQSSERLTSADRLTDLLGKVSYTLQKGSTIKNTVPGIMLSNTSLILSSSAIT